MDDHHFSYISKLKFLKKINKNKNPASELL
jgi:hypothetical protein